MTEKQKKLLAENPAEFLKSCWYHNQWIKLKLEEIRHYRDIAESITAEIKEVTTFGLTPSCKVENCVVEIVSIQEMLQARVKELRSDLDAVQEAINLLEDETQKSQFLFPVLTGGLYGFMVRRLKKFLKKPC